MNPTPEQVRQQVERMVATPGFASSERLVRFVRYITDRALSGRGADLKEYSIATEVYDRPTSFDPRIDSIVRVEAGRLRTRLRDYYLGPGAADPVVIELPKGTYVPSFTSRLPEPVPVSRRSLVPAAAALAIAALAGAVWYHWPAAKGVRAVGVLPLVNLGMEQSDETFARGLTEELTSSLSAIQGLKVASRSAMDQYRGARVDPRKAAADRRVDALIEGSIRRSGDRFRVTIQLISAADGYHLWAETFDRNAKDWLAVQSEISGAVTSQIRARFLGQAAWRQDGRGQSSPEVMPVYSAAREVLASESGSTQPGTLPPNVRQAVSLFEQATARDPNFGFGWSGLAQALQYSAEFVPAERDERMRRAEKAAAKALELDDTLAEAHWVTGSIRFFFHLDLIGAERSLGRAIELDPRNPYPQREYIDVLRVTGRVPEAYTAIRRARTFDRRPHVLAAQEGLLLFQSGRNEEAMRAAREALALRSDYHTAHWLLGLLHEQAGRDGEAEKEFRVVLASRPSDSRCLAGLGHLLARTHRQKEAREVAARIAASSLVEFPMALVHTGLGEHDQALTALERAYEKRDSSIAFVNVEPRFAPIRNHPRFLALLKRLGLNDNRER